MVAVMIGSMVYDSLTARVTPETIAPSLYLVAAGALLVPMLTEDRALVFWSFVLFEVCCGLHFPLISTLRSRFIPEEARSAVLNLVRIPLNLIVVVILLKVRVCACAPHTAADVEIT
jgi:MFS transporter, MFS domain-containing protein family, molybdate-anion transporter